MSGDPETPRFLCDRMLERLGRYLRAAGYDTWIAGAGDADATILRRHRDDARILLTCDAALAARASARGPALRLPATGLDPAARALTGLPPRARELCGPVTRWPACERLYWPGSRVLASAVSMEVEILAWWL